MSAIWTRRQWLRAALATGTGLAAPVGWARADTAPDVELRLTMAADAVPIWPGEKTRVLRFTGEVLRGRPDALRPLGAYLGPTLELRRGERVRIQLDNRLDEASIVHWHGLIVPERADGHPRFAVPPGSRYTYEFTVTNPAGTYWYHPHPHGRTGFQVYHGLAGLLIVREPWEATAGLPAGSHELPLVIQDRRVDADHQFAFADAMMDRMTGVLGDTVLVNGRPEAAFTVSPRPYRLRILNGSNARIYKLAWSDGRPLTVIGTDNGLLTATEGPQTRPYVMLGPSERVEILADFASRRPGTELALLSRSFTTGSRMTMGGMMGGGMMGGMMSDSMMGGGQGRELLIARFAVRAERAHRGEPLRLPEAAPEPLQPRLERETRLAFRHMQGLLNGRRFAMEAVADDERLPHGEPVLWSFENGGEPGMAMPHPIHIHGTRFRVVERQRGAPEDVTEGLLDAGFQDTVLVFPGERVRVLFAPTERGLFLYHCHNLEHEDGGMMRNYFVET